MASWAVWMQIGCPTKCSFFSLGIIDGDDDDDGLLSVSWWWYAAQFSAVVPFPNTSLSLAPDLLHKIFALLPTKRQVIQLASAVVMAVTIIYIA